MPINPSSPSTDLLKHISASFGTPCPHVLSLWSLWYVITFPFSHIIIFVNTSFPGDIDKTKEKSPVQRRSNANKSFFAACCSPEMYVGF